MPLRLATLPAALIAALAVAAPAGAAEYCVHKVGSCAAGTIDKGANLQAALSEAAGTPASDVVRVRSGTYSGPFTYTSDHPVEIIGAGSAVTKLTAQESADDFAEEVLSAVNADVSRLRVIVPDAAWWTGITLAPGSSANQVTVVRTPGSDQNITGVNLIDGASLRSSTVEVGPENGAAVVTTALSSEVVVVDSTLTGRYGVLVQAGLGAGYASVIRSTRIRGLTPLYVENGTAVLENSVLQQTATGASAVEVKCADWGGPTGSLRGDHVTIQAASDAVPIVHAACLEDGKAVSVDLTNSIARGAPAYQRHGSSGGSATVNLAHSDVQLGGTLQTGPGEVTTTGLIDADPLYAPGTLQPQPGSPVIDAGAPGPAAQALDFLGAPRLLGERQDMGAFEFDPGDAPPPPDPVGPEPAAPADPPAVTPAPAADPSPLAAALLTELRVTLAGRRGRVYRHRYLVPGTLRIRWLIRGRVVAKATLVRSGSGVARLRVKGKRRVLRRVRRSRLVAVGTFAARGHATVRAQRRG